MASLSEPLKERFVSMEGLNARRLHGTCWHQVVSKQILADNLIALCTIGTQHKQQFVATSKEYRDRLATYKLNADVLYNDVLYNGCVDVVR